jgi:hypothetical protein
MAAPKSDRPPLAARTFRLVDEQVRERIINAMRHLPIDTLRPLEIVVREHKPQRGADQNSLYWALLNEIAGQAWIEGRQYSAEVLHEYMKRNLLPEDGYADPRDVRDGYQKWTYDPAGERVLVGSTTMLTVRGFANLITTVEAFGAALGVQFRTGDIT